MKRKIHIDREVPDSKRIASFKDFDSLVEKHKAITKKPRYRSIKALTGLIIIALIGLLVMEAKRFEDRAISPPFPERNLDWETFELDSKHSHTIRTMSGTILNIEAQSFNEGKVLFQIREYTNPYEVFLSGITMQVDSSNATYVFESASIIEFRALNASNNSNLKLLKPLSVTVNRKASSFVFDTTENQWRKMNLRIQEDGQVTLNQSGIWNLSRLEMLEPQLLLKPRFENQNELGSFERIYYANEDDSQIISTSIEREIIVRDTNSSYGLWFVNDDKQIGVVDAKEFHSAIKKGSLMKVKLFDQEAGLEVLRQKIGSNLSD